MKLLTFICEFKSRAERTVRPKLSSIILLHLNAKAPLDVSIVPELHHQWCSRIHDNKMGKTATHKPRLNVLKTPLVYENLFLNWMNKGFVCSQGKWCGPRDWAEYQLSCQHWGGSKATPLTSDGLHQALKAVSHDFTYRKHFFFLFQHKCKWEARRQDSDVNAFGNAHPEDNAEGDLLALFPMTGDQ